MTISELIKILETLDGETTIVVVTSNYEGDWIEKNFVIKALDGKAYVWTLFLDYEFMEDGKVNDLIGDAEAVTPPGAD